MIDINNSKQFPILDKYCYLDHAGVGPISARVKDRITAFLDDSLRNAGFNYDSWDEQIDHARKSCAKLVNCHSEEIAFIKSTSHGISLVSSGIDWQKGDNVVIYRKEFPSNIYPWLNLASKGVEVKFLEGDNGEIQLSEIESKVNSKTRLISISSVQYTNGFRSDLKAIGEFCSKNNILFLVDGIQGLGVIPIDVKELKIDFLAADGHKWLMAPEGTGLFYCNQDKLDVLTPSLVGWKSIVNEFEYGTIDFDLKKNALKFEEGSLNVMGVLGLGEAIDYLLEIGINNIQDRVQSLGDYVIENIKQRGFILRTPEDKSKRAGIISFIGDFDPQNLKDRLQELGYMVNYRGGGIRVSPHFYNNEEHLDNLFNKIDEII